MRCPICNREFIGGSICPRCGRPVRAQYLCPQCGSPVAGNFCAQCGARMQTPPHYAGQPPFMADNTSDKDKWVAFFLCLFLGGLGIHRFYVGKVGTGILWLCLFAATSGVWIIAVVIDLIFIVMGKFRDKAGLYLR